MPDPLPTATQDTAPAPRQRIPRHIYPLRVLGMGLGALLVGSVLRELQAPAPHWALLVATLLWPHLAYLLARRSADPYRAEVRNLLVDSAIVGLWVPLMHFNLLPSTVLVAVTTYDKISTGIKRLWLHSLPGMLGVGALATLVTQPAPWLESPLTVVACTLPLLVVHTLATSMASYRLIRTVSRQNRQLEALRQLDAQTGLYARNHWQEQAEAALRHAQASGEPACLLMIDIDHFKPVNDIHGHTVGDEVIGAVGRIIRDCVRAQDCAGRYGGDEFAVVCRRTTPDEALAIAQRIRERVQALRLHALPQLRLTGSIGVAQAGPQHAQLRDWMNETDAALYGAKHGGRNRVAHAGADALAHASA
ncbi:diguanylate cyclase [Acidovorax sp. SRB_24]|uniref:diguanylate cyclase n=1 Tax=Acidovorax sp. SRB_24 TaxID=1962700 RepID=UPI00145C4D28|nr:diguanylate cyclase [Acidovorax sp. SRB_24]NMM78464.1 diguanylate cyclase AdrA [Acidovorax sp. SRB_24]NMM78691.1 diguanylate cyclase AdrA [Acidovorax sp. SRB_24]